MKNLIAPFIIFSNIVGILLFFTMLLHKLGNGNKNNKQTNLSQQNKLFKNIYNIIKLLE